MNNPAELTLARSIGYASGNLGKNLLWNSLEFCLLLILTDLLRVSPALAGAAIMLSVIWDALLDPIFGHFFDKLRSGRSGYGSFLLLGAPLCSLAYLCIFGITLLPMEDKFIPIVAALMLFRTFYTAVDLPHNALIARITNSAKRRSVLSGLRYLFSSLGSFLIALSLVPILENDSTRMQAKAFFEFAAVFSVIATLSIWLAWWSIRDRDRVVWVDCEGHIGLSQRLGALFACRSFNLLLITVFLTGLGPPLFVKTFLYYCKYVISDESLAGFGLGSYTIGSALGVGAWIWVCSVWSKNQVLRFCHALLAISLISFFFVTPDTSLEIGLVAGLIGAACGGVYMLIWSLAADIVDESEFASDIRSEATAFGIYILSMKFMLGIGSYLCGTALNVVGYIPDEAQRDHVLLTIRILMSLMPAAGSLIVIIVLSGYQLDHRRHGKIIQALLERKKNRSI